MNDSRQVRFNGLRNVFHDCENDRQGKLGSESIPVRRPPPFCLLFRRRVFQRVLQRYLPNLVVCRRRLKEMFVCNRFFRFGNGQGLHRLTVLVHNAPFDLTRLNGRSRSLRVYVTRHYHRRNSGRTSVVRRGEGLARFWEGACARGNRSRSDGRPSVGRRRQPREGRLQGTSSVYQELNEEGLPRRSRGSDSGHRACRKEGYDHVVARPSRAMRPSAGSVRTYRR